ncbi:DUF551 domain-containing protein [Enterobacter cloacae subsp. cloacae]|uniref:DUF551 domain-containing protein n=1 Tax=Enterobacter cloacae TaxID=550 RepID=UPI001FF50BF2|nr:DUF551 domain-containing protein [Enterobacter cloacae]MCK1077483.1 DUF551 domain-containing protein [Enterobacter cloacae subsp. cloacae]
MSNIDKEWLQQKIADMEAARDEIPFGLGEDDSNTLAALRIALASLEAEPVSVFKIDHESSLIKHVKRVVSETNAQPAPVSVPAAMEMDDDFDSAFEHGKAVGWNACRAAMLQGADGTLTNEGTIPVTQFKPVADLYGLTSPTGCETSFTFDAVEARDFIDGGWSCQEYVELERFQEAITNHTEDKLAMVDHSGDSNNMVEPVTTAYKLPANVIDALEKALQAMSFMGDTLNDMDAVCEEDIEYVTPAFDAVRKVLEGNYPVMPDGWVACSERMPEQFKAILAFNEYGEVWSGAYDRYWNFYCDNLLVEHVTHWMPLPAAPQQEA